MADNVIGRRCWMGQKWSNDVRLVWQGHLGQLFRSAPFLLPFCSPFFNSQFQQRNATREMWRLNPHIIVLSHILRLDPQIETHAKDSMQAQKGTTIYDALLPGFDQGTIICPNIIPISHFGPKELPKLNPVCGRCKKKDPKGMMCCSRCSNSIHKMCLDASVICVGAWMCKGCSDYIEDNNNLWLLPGSTQLSKFAEQLHRSVLKTSTTCKRALWYVQRAVTCWSIFYCTIFYVYC